MIRDLPRQRSYLAVPATSERFLEKASKCDADAIFIDLEDAVVPDAKAEGRRRAVEALNRIDWGERLVCVRVNGLDTAWGCHDVMEIASRAKRVDRLLLAKCETPQEVHAADTIIRAAERELPREKPLQIEALIESARGVVNVEAIAAASDRMAALVFGAGDYQVDMGAIGEKPRWDYALARIANAARAFGLAPIDSPFVDIANTTRLEELAQQAAAEGFEGKMCIHPSQITACNAAFTPAGEQVEWAHQALRLMADGVKAGKGAVRGPRGEMLDLMHEKMARRILARAGDL
jgi:malyl-CoA/(S)-citramalyl-CoA lyase